jgi:hypothetical protein
MKGALAPATAADVSDVVIVMPPVANVGLVLMGFDLVLVVEDT